MTKKIKCADKKCQNVNMKELPPFLTPFLGIFHRVIVAILILECQLLAAEQGGHASDEPVALGKLEPFWRYCAALGPFLESGYSLLEIPDYALKGDFPYRKRPFKQEAPFADHLSIVRLLGGCNSPKNGNAGGKSDESDLAYRDTSGKIQYRMELLEPRLRPYLDMGYTDLTLVLDNVPWCFPEEPESGSPLGQSAPPRDVGEWHDFIKEVCLAIKRIMGPDAGQHLRFRVGTENNVVERFNGTQEQYQQHYDGASTAVREVFPDAKFGPFNFSVASVRTIDEDQNVGAFKLAEHCLAEASPFEWVAFSCYYRPGNDPTLSVAGCRGIWEEFGRRYPQLNNVSREIHEFGIAPFGEAEKGQFASEEPGALGAALTCQMMWRLLESGINRLWHWPLYDRFRDRQNNLQFLFTSQAWLLSIMDHMAGGEAFLFPPLTLSPSLTKHLMAGSFQNGRVLLMISAYNTDSASQDEETVQFLIPPELMKPGIKTARFVQLTRGAAMYDGIRRDLDSAGLLHENFVSRPDRLGTVREMSVGGEGEKFVGDRLEDYASQWVESLTLKPLDASVGTIESDGAGTLVTVQLTAPEVLVIEIR